MDIQTLAASLRRMSDTDDVKLARGHAHIAFDKLWKSGHMSRSQAYAWLAHELGMSRKRAHIENFDVAQCKYVIARVKHFMPNLYV